MSCDNTTELPSTAGILVVQEGQDGCGKSTTTDLICEWFAERGREVVKTREPGGTELGEALRGLLLHHDMDAVSETLLLLAARREHVLKVIKPALRAGKVVVCDRFSDSTYAYQAAGKGVDANLVNDMERVVQGWCRPTVTLWYDVSAQEARRRRNAGRSEPDRFEREDDEFFERVSEGYRHRAQRFAWRFFRVDASQSPEAVWGQVSGELNRRFAHLISSTLTLDQA